MIGSVFSFARSWRIGAALLIGAAGVLVPVTQAAGADGPLVVSLTFNDGRMTQYSYARPVLRAHNVFGTFYVSSKVIEANAPGYMATWHVDALYRDGDEIGGLTKDHVDLTAQHDPDPAADLAWKQDQVCGDKQRLAQLGYDPQSFSYPFAAVNAAAESIVQGCGYLSGRTVGGLSTTTGPYALTNPPADPYWLSTANLPTGPIQLSTLQNAVTAAVSHGGGWLPVAFDQVCDSADPNYSSCMGSYKPIDATVLSDFLDWLQNGAPAGVSVARVRDVMGAPPQPPLPPRPTVVSLTFDDGDKTQYGVRPILNDAHVHGTFYVNTGAVDSGDEASMTWTQIHNLANDGNDVGGHTRDHMDLTSTSTSYDYKWHQACDDRARLQEQGLWPASFAYPFAAFNATAAEIVRGCGYQSGRTGGSILVGGPLYSEKIPPPDAYTIKTLGTLYNGAITLQWLQDAVNGAADRAGGWVPMVFHEICYTADPDFGTCMNGYRPVSDTTLTQFIDWVAQQANRGVSIKSVTEVMSGGQTLPSVRITAPPAGGSTAQSPVIGGTASGTGDVTVALYAGPYSVGTPVATVVAPVTSGTWSARIPGPLAQGTYTAQANQTAGALTGYSSPQTFAVVADITAPAVQITAPRSGERTNKTTPVISGTAGTAADDNPAVTVDIYSGSTPGGTPLQTLNATADGTGAWSVQTAQALTEGTYTAVATQSDIYANTGTSTPVVFTVDLTVPVVQITAPADGSRTNVTTPVISGTASTLAGDFPAVTVDVYSGGTATGTPVQTLNATADGTGAWSVTAAALPDGTYTALARQSDESGNTGASLPVTFAVDTTAPAVHITGPADGSRTNSTTPVISGTAGIAAGDNPAVTVKLYSGGTPTGTPLQTLNATADGTGAWSVPVAAALAQGTYTAQATQADATANTGTSTVVFAVDTIAPVVRITSPASGATVTANPFTVSGTAGTTAGDLSTITLNVYVGTSTTPTQTLTTTASGGTWIASVAGLAPSGSYTLRASQSDSAGNTGLSNSVTVKPRSPMTVTAPSPNTIGQGATGRAIGVNGTGFTAATVVSLSGTGLTITSSTFVSSTRINVTVDAAADAPAGKRDIVVSRAGTYDARCANCLTVNVGPKPTSVSPASVSRGTVPTVKVKGTGFASGAQVAFSGDGLTWTVTGRTSTTITVALVVSPLATTGSRDVTVTNSDGGTGICRNCLTVT